MGRNWPTFSEAQKQRFDTAFANLLLITYLDKVQGYNGEKIAYTGEVMSSKGDRAEIQTVVTLSDGKAVPVAYRMMLKNGRWVVYDVLIENVSLIKNYRSQFQDVLSPGNARAAY
ncbi:MAG: ABC transporter substrate-binding protein [Bilophila sp.]